MGNTLDLDNFSALTFYGFRMDPNTGRLTVDIIGDGDETPIKLPQDGIYGSDDYKQTLFSKRAMQFNWNASHLQVKII